MKLSLITACYNNALVIRECLASARGQTGDFGLEHLIQDGGSTDGTLDLLEAYRASTGYGVSIQSGPDAGFYDAINRGIARATGDVAGLLNADDFFARADVLAGVAKAFAEDPELEVVYGDLDFIEAVKSASVISYSLMDNGDTRRFFEEAQSRFRVTRRWRAGTFSPAKFRRGWVPPHPTVYVRRSVLERTGPYRLDFGSSADYEFLLRVFVVNQFKIKYLPKVMVEMRMGGQSTGSWKSRLLANKNDRRAWELNGRKPAPFFRLLKPMRKLSQWF